MATLGAACGGDDAGPTLPRSTTTTRATSGATGTGVAGSGATGTGATGTGATGSGVAGSGVSGSGASGVTTTKASGATGAVTTPTVFTTTPANTVAGPAKLVNSSAVSTAGIGPLTFGLTVPNAEKALGARLLPDAAFPSGGQCIVVKPEAGADAVWFTVWKNTIERLDVRPPGKVKTRSGAGIASTEAQLKALFTDRLTFTANPSGKTAVYTPQDAANADFRIIFELDLGGIVTSYRAGRVGVVEASAPCA